MTYIPVQNAAQGILYAKTSAPDRSQKVTKEAKTRSNDVHKDGIIVVRFDHCFFMINMIK
jgi:hypothetical protein